MPEETGTGKVRARNGVAFSNFFSTLMKLWPVAVPLVLWGVSVEVRMAQEVAPPA